MNETKLPPYSDSQPPLPEEPIDIVSASNHPPQKKQLIEIIKREIQSLIDSYIEYAKNAEL